MENIIITPVSGDENLADKDKKFIIQSPVIIPEPITPPARTINITMIQSRINRRNGLKSQLQKQIDIIDMDNTEGQELIDRLVKEYGLKL